MFIVNESNPGSGNGSYGPFHKTQAIAKAIAILAERILDMPDDFASIDLNEELRMLSESGFREYESAGYGIFSLQVTKLK